MKLATVFRIMSMCCAGTFLIALLVGFYLISPRSEYAGTAAATLAISALCCIFFGGMAILTRKPLTKGRPYTAIGIGMALLALLVVVVAIPNLLSGKIKPCVSAVVFHLRNIAVAEKSYKSKYGTCGTLEQLADSDLIDKTLAAATDKDNAKAGYYYELTIICPDTWYCIARPSKWGFTGIRNFMISDKDTIYWNAEEDSSEFTKSWGNR